MVDWIKKIDPHHRRTIFCFSQFYKNTLGNISTPQELKRYFSGVKKIFLLDAKPKLINCQSLILTGSPVNGAFYISLFSAALRKKMTQEGVLFLPWPEEGPKGSLIYQMFRKPTLRECSKQFREI